MAAFAPTIEIELPSGDILEMTEDEFSSIKNISQILAAIPREKMDYFNPIDAEAFQLYTTSVQPSETKPVGSNTPTGQDKVYDLQGGEVGQNKKFLIEAMDKAGITDTDTRAAIAAVSQGESGFEMGSEADYSTTSNSSIRNLFSAVSGMSDKELTSLKQDPKAFFNKVYGGRIGNAPDEGYTYRGRGLIQLTGKGNYDKYGKELGIDLVKNPDLMNDPKISAAVTVAYVRDRLPKAEGKDILEKVARATGRAVDETEGKKRQAFELYKTSNEFSTADKPGAMKNLIDYDLEGKVRSQKLSPTLEAKLSQAVGQVYGEGYKARVYSGGQESNEPGKGTGSIRHNAGMAGDVYIVGPDGNVIQDETQLDKLKNYWSENKLGSVGTYMAGGGMHLDEWTEDKLLPGMGLSWPYQK